MALILNGTLGLSDVDGTAATPAIRGTDSNTGIFFPAADQFAASVGGTEGLRLTSTGLGIGTSSPAVKLDVNGSIRIPALTGFQLGNGSTYYYTTATSNGNFIFGTSSADRMTLDSSGNLGLGVTPSAWGSQKALEFAYGGLSIGSSLGVELVANTFWNGSNWIYRASSAAQRYEQDSGGHKWYTAPSGTAGNAISFTQAMTLDSSGNLLVGRTSGTGARFDVTGSTEIASFQNTSGTGNARFLNSGGSTIGYIQWSGSTTSYVTSSDYRLKNTIAPMTGALAKVALLKPCTYTWNADGSAGEGFIAHELAEVCPAAVTGEKDAVDSDGNPQYQGIDVSFLVGTLTAAIQEQQAIIESLKADVAALKGTA